MLEAFEKELVRTGVNHGFFRNYIAIWACNAEKVTFFAYHFKKVCTFRFDVANYLTVDLLMVNQNCLTAS